MENVSFKRCIKPDSAVGKPTLVMFSDGSQEAYGTCAYVRWKLENGSFDANLLSAKSRIAPVRQITIVRLELNGAVLSKRLKDTITKESDMNLKKFTSLLIRKSLKP